MEKREKDVQPISEEVLLAAREKQQGQRVQRLKKRSGRCVCKYCGGKLGLRKITYAAYDEAKIEIYCNSCDRIEYGTEPLFYKMSAYFIDAFGFDYYPELDDSVNKSRMNRAMVSNIIGWGFKNAGLLDEDGLTCPIAVDERLLGEATILSESRLQELLKE